MDRAEPPSDGGTVEVLTADITDELLETPALQGFWAYWCELAGGPAGAPPLRKTLDVSRMEDYLDSVTLVEVVPAPDMPDGRDYHYRVFGTGLAQLEGQDFTGRSVSQITSYMQPAVRQQNARVVEEARPVFCRARTPPSYPAARWLRLACPLSHDGTAVDQVIAVVAGLDLRTAMPPYL